MCFRPAEAELPPVLCPNCGKKINRIGGALPSKCPFCKEPTDGIEDAAATAASAPVSAPGAPSAPSAPAPAAPSTPTNPKDN